MKPAATKLGASICVIVLVASFAYLAYAQDASPSIEAPDPAAPTREAPHDVAPHRAHTKATKKKISKTEPQPSARHPVANDANASAPPAPAGGTQSPPAQARVPQSPAAAVGELEPVLQARQAKLGVCMDNVLGQAGSVITAPHTALSTWVSAAPNENVFQSIVGMNYPASLAPNGAAVLLSAPLNDKKCEGQSIQIIPSAQSCTAIQASIVQTKVGSTLAMLKGLPLMQMKSGSRELLIPSAGNGCVLVGIRLR